MNRKRELEQKLAEPFRKVMGAKETILEETDEALKENRGRVRGWPAYEKTMRAQTLDAFDTWEEQLDQSASPMKPSYFKKARRGLWLYSARTWLHWRGVVYRLQILGMWTVRLGIIAGIGMAIIAMGGGRRQVTDTIDHSVGLEVLVRIGDPVEENQPIAHVFTAKPRQHAAAVRNAFTIGESAKSLPLIVDTIERETL